MGAWNRVHQRGGGRQRQGGGGQAAEAVGAAEASCAPWGAVMRSYALPARSVAGGRAPEVRTSTNLSAFGWRPLDAGPGASSQSQDRSV